MYCPTCLRLEGRKNEKLQVVETRRSSDGKSTRRERRCEAGHSVTTTETFDLPPLKNVAVASWKHGCLSGRFNRESLFEDVTLAVAGFMQKSDVVRLVDQACDALAADLADLRLDLTDADRVVVDQWDRLNQERKKHGPVKEVIWDRHILVAVERAFQETSSFRIAGLLYTMAHRGSDAPASGPQLPGYASEGQRTYKEIPDVPKSINDAMTLLKWLSVRYPQLKPEQGVEDRQADRGALVQEVWWHWFPKDGEPGVDPPEQDYEKWLQAPGRWWPNRRHSHPDWVLKSNGTRVEFRLRQLRQSLERALVTKPGLVHIVPEIAEWVLGRLEGQKIVKSSQLAAFAMQGLRRLDDLSYLRFAIIQKKYKHVDDCIPEIVGLIRYPSRRLTIAPSADPADMTPTRVNEVEDAVTKLQAWLDAYKRVQGAKPAPEKDES
jgi:transcriptional regulator NrdR family protein